jgi:hypothetical protein
MRYIQTIKFAGLCLVALAAMAMATAATASAAPVWEQCEKGAAGTKWETNLCNKIGPPNEYAWQEVKSTEAVVTEGSLRLTDLKGGLEKEKVTVECFGKDEGTIGPGKFDRITAITASACHNIENCPEILKVRAEAVNLPWQTELYETEPGKVRDQITSTISGKFPGWKVVCSGVSDTCEANTSTAMTNKQAEGVVQATFETKSGRATCTRGGAGQGEVIGSVITKATAGHAIRVS